MLDSNLLIDTLLSLALLFIILIIISIFLSLAILFFTKHKS